MISTLALWQELVMLGLACLGLCYVFYFRIWTALATGSDLLFAAALGVATLAVATPIPFERAADEVIERSPLPEALASADRRIAELEALPSRLIASALARIGYESEPEAPETLPSEPGPFESRIRPSVEALLTLSMRVSGFACATFLLFAALAMRSSTSTASRLREILIRIESLEASQAAGKPG